MEDCSLPTWPARRATGSSTLAALQGILQPHPTSPSLQPCPVLLMCSLVPSRHLTSHNGPCHCSVLHRGVLKKPLKMMLVWVILLKLDFFGFFSLPMPSQLFSCSGFPCSKCPGRHGGPCQPSLGSCPHKHCWAVPVGLLLPGRSLLRTSTLICCHPFSHLL